MPIAHIEELPYPDFTGFTTEQSAEETIDKICEYLKSQHRALSASEGDKPANFKEIELLSRRFTFFLTGKSGVNVQPLVISAHASAHQAGGADSIKLDNLAAPDDNTDLDFSTSLHGLVPKGINLGKFLKDNGTWDNETSHATVLVDGDFSSSGLMKTDGAGAYSVVADTLHTQNTDTALGSGAVSKDHGTAATDQIVNVCYGTGSPPTANTTTEGTLFIKYTA